MNRAELRQAEREFARQVHLIVDEFGLLAHWCPDARKCGGHRGFPDLIVLGTRGLAFAELKMPDEDTTPAQDMWAFRLALNGQPYHLWGPADLESGRIRAVLRQLR